MDHFTFGMFAEAADYDAREENNQETNQTEHDNDGDYIPGFDDGEWMEAEEQEGEEG